MMIFLSLFRLLPLIIFVSHKESTVALQLHIQTTKTMKTTSILVAALASASAFAPISQNARTNTALADVPLANGSMSFNRVCREWRLKYEGDKSTSESLESVAKVVEELLPEIKKASDDVTVNRLVCGSCLDFKLMTTVPLEDYGKWEEAGHPPEKEFLEKVKAIPGVSLVETQTITNMEI